MVSIVNSSLYIKDELFVCCYGVDLVSLSFEENSYSVIETDGPQPLEVCVDATPLERDGITALVILIEGSAEGRLLVSSWSSDAFSNHNHSKLFNTQLEMTLF